MRWPAALPFALLTCAILAGCGRSDDAAMPIRGGDVSLSLVREKPYFWSSGWDVSFVVSNMPDCTRRHHAKHVGDGKFRVDVYDAGGGWILNQGRRWYAVDVPSCEMRQFDDKPASPGTLAGSFVADDEAKLSFNKAPAAAEPAVAPAQ